jgi:flagellin-like hook-associated protein FlgL
MTTVGTLKNYRYSLNRSNNTMAKAMETVLTGRLFNSYAEDPALATRCFQIRRSFWRASSQLEVNESLRHKYDVAWSALENASTDLYSRADDASVASIIRSLSDPTGPGRPALGQSLCAKAKDIAQIMNGRYGENYVFAGADTLNAPFTWEPKENSAYIANPDATNPDHARAFQYEIDPAKAQNGELYTNDPANALQVPQKNPNYDEEFTKNATVADVDDPRYGEFLTPDGKGTTNDKIANLVPKENEKYDETSSFKYLKADGTGTNEVSEAAQALYYRGVPVDSDAPADVKKMEYFLKQERKDIDVGLGHKEQNGEVVTSTVFDSSLQGIYFMDGYGTKSVELKNDDGTTTTVENIPKNIISIVNEMGQILQRCSKDDGNWASPEDEDRFNALAQAFEDSNSVFRERWTEMDTQSGFLRDNSELLTDTKDSLKQQYMELEDANPAGAISDYMFARYCYDTALKVGNSVLSQSLMDYMNF